MVAEEVEHEHAGVDVVLEPGGALEVLVSDDAPDLEDGMRVRLDQVDRSMELIESAEVASG